MTRIPRIAAAAALMGGIAASGMVMAQDGQPPDALTGPMAMGRGGLDFVVIDTDGNGSLSRAELQARAVARLSALDTNQDGALDRAELVAVLSDGRGRLVALFTVDPAEEMADRMLALMGGTEAGKVEVAVIADGRVNRLLAFADTDHDAAISKAEADAMQARVASGQDRHDRHRGDRHERPKGPPPPPGAPGADGPGGSDGQPG